MAAADAGGIAGFVQRAWSHTIVRSATAIVIGVIALKAPGTVALVAALAFGVYALGDGLTHVIEALLEPPSVGRWPRIVAGLMVAGIGIVILVWPRETLTVGVLAFAGSIILLGVLQALAGLATRRISGSGWGWAVVAGIVAMAFGALVLFFPMAGLTSITWVIALWTILWGVATLWLALQLRSAARTLADTNV